MQDGVINLNGNVNPDKSFPGDHNTHFKYTNTQLFNTWYVPVSKEKTITLKSNWTTETEGKTTYNKDALEAISD